MAKRLTGSQAAEQDVGAGDMNRFRLGVEPRGW
jgi:hypothetical protein